MSLVTYSHPPIDTDIVSVSAIQLAVAVGPDHWHRTRLQPVYLSLQLHLAPSYLNAPGKSDDVFDSLHYGHLAKALQKRVSGKAGGYATVRALMEDTTDAAFGFAREAVGTLPRDGVVAQAEVVRAVRVVVQLPKQILLARSFEVELVTPGDLVSSSGPGTVVAGSGTVAAKSKAGAIIRVTDLVLPVLIGVNPPERLAKQRVVTHLTFFEAGPTEVERAVEQESEINYPAIIQQIVMDIESSSYLTLEKLVYEIIRTAYHTSEANQPGRGSRIKAITVRCQKPSALSFADASEVEMTRTRQTL